MLRCLYVIIALAAAALVLPRAAAADLSFRLTAHFDGTTRFAPPGLDVDVSSQGAMTAYDSAVSFQGSTFHIVNICDATAGKLTTIDPQLKIYAVQDAGAVEAVPLGIGVLAPCYAPGAQGLLLPLPVPSRSGISVALAVADRGMDKIGRAAAHHWTISWTSAPGSAFDAVDVWTDDAVARPIDAVALAAIQSGAYAGDVDKLRSVLSSEPVKIQIDLIAPPPGSAPAPKGSADSVTYSADRLSTKTIDPAVFAVPAKFRQVSPDDFVAEERQAVQKRLAGSGPAPSGVPNNTGAAPVPPPGLMGPGSLQ
jgi:hypothetical protein